MPCPDHFWSQLIISSRISIASNRNTKTRTISRTKRPDFLVKSQHTQKPYQFPRKNGLNFLSNPDAKTSFNFPDFFLLDFSAMLEFLTAFRFPEFFKSFGIFPIFWPPVSTAVLVIHMLVVLVLLGTLPKIARKRVHWRSKCEAFSH